MGGGGSGVNNSLGHHQTLFFGPAHGFSQYSSLPRRAAGSAFQRNTPIRRSTGIPEHHIEYFVPRSVSEFNLSGVGDLALPPPRRCSPTIQSGGGLGLPHGLQLGPPQTLICSANLQQQQQQPPPPQQLQIVMKPREKMVTFEDESKAANGAGVHGMGVNVSQAPTHCPHGVPTTPSRKSALNNVTGIGGGGSGGGGGTTPDVFM